MPIYDLYCPTCKTTKEYLIESSKSNYVDCEQCSTRLERKISSVHFRFKDQTNTNSFKKNRKTEPIVPFNLVDIKQDGSYKLISTSNNPEIL